MKRTKTRLSTAALLLGMFCLSSGVSARQKPADDWRAAWRKQWIQSHPGHADTAWREAWRKKWQAAHTMSQSGASSLVSSSGRTLGETPHSEAHSVPRQSAPPVTLPAKPDANPVSAATAPVTSAVPATATLTAPKNAIAPAVIPAPLTSAPKVETKPAASEKSAPTAKTPIIEPVTPKTAASPLAETRPDPAPEPKKTADQPLDSPMGAVNDGGRMFLYLIPTVLLMVGALHLLRRFQEKKGRLPAFAQMGAAPKTLRNAKPKNINPKSGKILRGLVGGFNLNRAQERGGGSIRLVESVPIGSANLHLIEVRGRVLLLGASANGLNLLTEIEEPDALANNEFRLLLEQAASDLDGLNLTDSGVSAPLIAGALDEPLRDASRAVTRGARRLRTVQEAEAAWEQEQK